jgi:hypothetical protein
VLLSPSDLRAPSKQSIADFYAKTHKLLNHQMDARFKGMQNFAGDVQKIIIAIQTGRQISTEQARILFTNLTCVIAEPGMISRHLPMTEDLVDYLIIDEASQVSIADSISLMLRAKQVIVFGDELQYGAVQPSSSRRSRSFARSFRGRENPRSSTSILSAERSSSVTTVP